VIPNAVPRDVVSGSVGAKGFFGISQANAVHIMTILRDNIYTDRVLAVLREYCANSWDAQREAGKGDRPIKVFTPTYSNPLFTTRDYGFGLSEEDVLTVYTQYGESTKRDSDSVVGYMGVGCKCGFCYTDSFTITSWYEGKKSIYTAVLDESEVGVIQKQYEEDCGVETGVEIQIAVRPEDVNEFRRKAAFLLSYFLPRPTVNVDLVQVKGVHLTHGTFVPKEDTDWGDKWIAVMGCVPYKVDMEQIKADLELADSRLYKAVTCSTGILRFEIGDVQISASREELKYSPKTKVALAQKVALLVEEYTEHIRAAIESSAEKDWNKRLRAWEFATTMGYSLFSDYSNSSVDLIPDDPDAAPLTFKLNEKGKVKIGRDTRIVIRNDSRAVKDLNFDDRDILILPIDGCSTADMKAELEEYLFAAAMDGVPIIYTQQLSSSWHSNYQQDKKKKIHNKKHHRKTFSLNEYVGKTVGRGCSVNWDVSDHEPTVDDVFVILKNFHTPQVSGFYDQVRADRSLAKEMGKDFPIIYGYKSTDKDSVEEADCLGTSYPVWREKFLLEMAEEYKEILLHWCWASRINSFELDDMEIATASTITRLGLDHPIVRMMHRILEARRYVSAVDGLLAVGLQKLRELSRDMLTTEKDRITEEVDSLYRKYPLLDHYGRRAFFVGENTQDWLDYIQRIDEEKESTK
jgi:hypothetical protein